MPGMATAVAARAGPLERPPIARRPAAPPILSLFQNCTAEESLTSPRNLFLKDTELVASSDDCCTDASPLSHSNTPHPKVGLLFRRDPFRQANSRAHLSRSESALSAQSDSSVLRLPESPPLPSGSQSQGHRKRKAFKALRVEVDPSTSEAVQDAPSETLSHETTPTSIPGTPGTAKRRKVAQGLVEQTLALVQHSSTCSSNSCSWQKCSSMKTIIRHMKETSSKLHDCEHCCQMLKILKYHAGLCNKTNCQTYLCKELKDGKHQSFLCKERKHKHGRQDDMILCHEHPSSQEDES